MESYQIKRGPEQKLPQLLPGELGFTTDTLKFFIGSDQGNVAFIDQAVVEKALNLLKQDIMDYCDSTVNDTAQGVHGNLENLVNSSVDNVNKTIETKLDKAELTALIPKIYTEIVTQIQKRSSMNDTKFLNKSELTKSLSEFNKQFTQLESTFNSNISELESKLKKADEEADSKLQTALNDINKKITESKKNTTQGLENRFATKADIGHRHRIADISGLQAALNSAGGTPAWGSITGTLANQTDLQSALDGKLSTTGTAVKATNLVGGDNTTLLGSIPYQSAADTTTLLSPNTTTTRKFLRMTGSGTNGAAPAWDTIVAGDIPTLNQNTTGSAATLTTARAIYGNNFDGSEALTQIIASTYGGTGNGFTKFSGPTSTEKTFTLPNANATIARTDAAQTFTGTQTFSQIVTTNNAITASGNAATVPITSRISTVTNNSAATLTITMATTGAVDGQLVMVRILDFSAAAQTITWVNTENSTISAPTTSNGSTTLPLTVGLQYNSNTSKWRCIASA